MGPMPRLSNLECSSMFPTQGLRSRYLPHFTSSSGFWLYCLNLLHRVTFLRAGRWDLVAVRSIIEIPNTGSPRPLCSGLGSHWVFSTLPPASHCLSAFPQWSGKKALRTFPFRPDELTLCCNTRFPHIFCFHRKYGYQFLMAKYFLLLWNAS